jgi:agmatinase
MDSAIDPLRLLRPPGRGILSFTTGARQNVDLEKRYFAKALRLQSWPEHVKDLLNKDSGLDFYFLGVPSDAGSGICRGSNHGPQFLREALYSAKKDFAGHDLGDVPTIPQLSDDEILSTAQLERSGRALWGDSYISGLPVSPLNLLEASLRRVWEENPEAKIFTIGGDHSISGAVFRALEGANKLKNLAVLHFDAHTDLLEERYGIRHCFATWTAHSVRKLANPRAWVQLGVRTSGFEKAHWEEKFGLQQIWAREVLKKSPEFVAKSLLKEWKSMGMTGFYVSLDVDALDAQQVPSTGTPEPKGLDLRWTEKVLEILLGELPLVSFDLVELAPVLGSAADSAKSVKAAARLAQVMLKSWQPRKSGRRK